MSPPIRLGYFIPQFPGQTHIFFWRELKALEKLGVIPELLSTSPPPPGLVAHDWSADAAARTTYLVRRDAQSILDAALHPPLKTLREAMRGESAALAKDLCLAVPAAKSLVRFSAKVGLDHIHVHSCGRAAIIAALAFGMGGPRYSLTLHGPLEDYGPGQRFKWRKAAFATVITEKLRGEIASTLNGSLPPSIAVQAMGVDTDRMSRSSPWEPPAPGEPVRVFSCGRLNPVKGHQDLLEAIQALRAKGIDASVTIAGEDDDGGNGYRHALEARIKELGLQSHATLLGAVSEPEVLRHLLSAHVFVLASWHEPLGVALMEAMACEVPTIGTASGGVAELITNGVDGVLVPPKDTSALAAAMLDLLKDPAKARRLGEAGRNRILSKFAAANSAETIVRMIAETRA